MKVFLILFIPLIFISSIGFGQKTSSELFLDLKKLASLKRVLYIAAHPDDENTRALAWLSLGEEAQTAYLSLTRGDGGQNLLGDELGADLGLLRSQELLAARNIDNAQQFFSRAVDFGYSRSAEESFKKWQKGEVLSDVVRVIRQFKPDVIITRFPPDERAGHGHHTASAMLAIEAYEKAADKTFLPEQVTSLGTWQPTSVYWNASNWWNKDLDKEAQNNPDYLIYDIGAYNTLLGKSYNEIGTLARSQHKCQGFGSLIERGERIEYFQHLTGEKLNKGFFEKSTRTWTTLVSKDLETQFQSLISNYNFVDAGKNIDPLREIYGELNKIQDPYLKQEKLKLCEQLIINSLGLHIDLLADDYSYAVTENIKLNLSLINRSNVKVEIGAITINGKTFQPSKADLPSNIVVENQIELKANNNFYNPYWLENPYENLFSVLNIDQIGNPTSAASITGSVQIIIGESTINCALKGEHIWGDPSYGERRREVVFTPNLAVTVDESSLIAKTGVTKKLKLKVHSFTNNATDNLTLTAPKGWEITPKTIAIQMDIKHQEQFVEITLKPTTTAVSGDFTITNKNGKSVQYFHEIKYDHIPSQVYFSDAKVKLVKINAEIANGKVAYIKGVEDKVPQAIEQLGFDLKMLDVSDLSFTDLSQFQTVVVGIRAYNVKPELMNFKKVLMSYVENGGNLIVQYNTASKEVKEMDLGPYPFEISRDRVTEEDAPPTFLIKEHELLNKPNTITELDFDNWVQERGLYFAGNWDEKYQTIISWGDTGQEQVEGGLIVAKYGKGNYIYTGISFFRELPSGVEGAYRLFANLLSYGRN